VAQETTSILYSREECDAKETAFLFEKERKEREVQVDYAMETPLRKGK